MLVSVLTDIHSLIIDRFPGVARDASKQAIRKSYLALAKKHHPDVNASPTSHRTFQRIQEAYATLSDEQKRKEYDARLEPDQVSILCFSVFIISDFFKI